MSRTFREKLFATLTHLLKARRETMIQKGLWWVALLAAWGLSGSAHAQQAPANDGQPASDHALVVFVCEHGSAKSPVAAAHFNRLARQRGLKLRAVSRGTHPDEKMAPKAAAGLRTDGLAAGAVKPLPFSAADVAGAVRVVAFCALPEGSDKRAPVEHWDDIPPVSEDYGKSRDALVKRITRLLDELRPAKQSVRGTSSKRAD